MISTDKTQLLLVNVSQEYAPNSSILFQLFHACSTILLFSCKRLFWSSYRDFMWVWYVQVDSEGHVTSLPRIVE